LVCLNSINHLELLLVIFIANKDLDTHLLVGKLKALTRNF